MHRLLKISAMLLLSAFIFSCTKTAIKSQKANNITNQSSGYSRVHSFTVACYHVKWEDGTFHAYEREDGTLGSYCNPGGDFCRAKVTVGFTINGQPAFYDPDNTPYAYQNLGDGVNDGIITGQENGNIKMYFDRTLLPENIRQNIADGILNTEGFQLTDLDGANFTVQKGSYNVTNHTNNVVEIYVPANTYY